MQADGHEAAAGLHSRNYVLDFYFFAGIGSSMETRRL